MSGTVTKKRRRQGRRPVAEEQRPCVKEEDQGSVAEEDLGDIVEVEEERGSHDTADCFACTYGAGGRLDHPRE